MKRVTKLLLIAFFCANASLQSALADSDPFPGVASGGEIPGTRIQSSPGVTQSQWEATSTYQNWSCPAGAGRAGGVDMAFTTTNADDTWFNYCVKTWQPQATIDAQAAYRDAVEAAQAAALAQSQAWNAANPGKQKCYQWGPITDPNGGTSSGGVCANPVEPGPGTTVPSQSAEGVTGPSAPISTAPVSAAATPTNDVSITGNGAPFTRVLAGQLSTDQCPAGYQAANGIIVAIGSGTFTECWPSAAWQAWRLGGTYWEQYKNSGGTYNIQAIVDQLAVIESYKSQAKALAQAAANTTPGVQRCSTWTVYGQSGEECAYTGIEPSPSSIAVAGDTRTASSSNDSATIRSSLETATVMNLSTSTVISDTSTASVELVPATVVATPPVAAQNLETVTPNSDSEPINSAPVNAELTAKVYSKGKVVLSISSDSGGVALTLIATKKGSKPIYIDVVTNADGDKKFATTKIPVGFTLTLKSGDQVLDKLVLRK